MERNGPYHQVPRDDFAYDNRAHRQERPYLNNSSYPNMEMAERNIGRELPEKPKIPEKPEEKKPIQEKEEKEDLRWGPRLYNFTQYTTVHGLRQIWEPTPFRIRRIIWIIIVLAGIALFIKQLIDSILYYCSHPVAVNVKINYNDTLLFPAITICNINSFRTTVAAQQGRYEMISHLFTMREDSRDPMSVFTGEEANITMDELFLASAHDKHDLIVGCMWNKQECSADDFEEILTDHGVCYSFNGGKNGSVLAVAHTGADRGLQLKLNIEQYEYMTGPNEGAGLKILVHDQSQFPLVRDLGQAVFPGAHAFVGVEVLQIHNLKEPYGKCDDEISLEFFETYSVSSCYVNCKQKFLLKECGCREFYMPPGEYNEEDTRVCMMSEYVQCVKSTLEKFEQEQRKSCECPIPCNDNLYDPIITYAANSNFDMAKMLQGDIKALADKYLKARETRQKVDDEIVAKDRWLIKKLGDAIRDVDDTFGDIERELNKVMETLNEEIEKLLKRVNFHSKYVLNGIEFIIEHDFIRGWEVIEERTLSIITTGFYEILSSMDRYIQQSNSTSILTDGSGDVSSVKDILWLIIDADLANKIDIIERARRNLTKVNEAYKSGKPIIKYKYSPEQRYDMSLIPMEVLHHDEENQNRYFQKIMEAADDFVDSIINIRNIGKEFLNDEKLDRVQYESAKTEFIRSAKAVNYRLFQYKSRIVDKSLEIVKGKTTEFVLLNETMTKNQADLRKLVASTVLLVGSQTRTTWKHIKQAGQKCHGYTLDFNASKTGLSQFLNSDKIYEDLIRLDNFFANLRSRAVDLLDLWAKMQQSYKEIFSSVVSETMTSEFYKMVNNDTKEFLLDPENNTEIYFPIFGPILNMDEPEFNSTNVTDLLHLLNADVPDINLDTKIQEMDTTFDNLKKQFDVTKYIKDRDEVFLAVIKILQNSLKVFANRNDLGFEFYRENFLHLDVFMRELSYEEITQQVAYDLTNLWSDIGGSLGLFIGASAITLFEVLDVFLHHAAKRRARQRRKEQAEREKNRLNNPQPVPGPVPIKRSRHHPEMPFDDDPFYHPPLSNDPQHQYAEPDYSEIRRPRQKRPSSRHDQPRHPRDRPGGGGGRRPRSKNYDDPSGYQLHPDRHQHGRRSRSKSPRPHYQR